jgi:O-antigen ligase/tetratricopeptide (TPR) repeat protein
LKYLSEVSWNRVFQRSGLLLLAIYLALAGGKYSGRVLYPLVWVNVWLVALGGLGWMVWRFLRKRPFPATPLDGPLLLWLAVLLLSALNSEDPRVSLERWEYELVCVLVFYLLVDLDRAGKRVETWLRMTIIAGSVFFLFGFQELFDWYRRWLSIGGLAQLIPPATIRVQATMGHANSLAAYLNCLWPLVAVRLLATSKKWLRWILGVYCGLCLVLLYFTSSRGGWLSALAAAGTLGMLLAVDQREKVTRVWRRFGASRWKLAGGLCATLIGLGVAGGLLLRQVQHPSHPSGNPRGYIWQVAINMFTQSPWLGTGPGTFPRYFLQFFSIPHGVLLGHAHQYFLNILGESGLPAFIVSLILSAVVAWRGWRQWRMGKKGERTILAGALAALAGLAVHSQFDLPQYTFLINILTAALLVSLMPLRRDRAEDGQKRLRWRGALLLAGWGAAAGLGFYVLQGLTPYQAALEAAGAGNWSLAREKMAEVVEKDPAMSIYRFQKGITEARLATDGGIKVIYPSMMEAALKDVEQAVHSQPEFALGWANLAVLKWQAGDGPGALSALEEAIQRAPESAGLYLLAGSLYEARGEAGAAWKAYHRALSLQPALSLWGVLPASPIWSQVVANGSEEYPYLGEGWRMMEAGDYAGAASYFEKSVGLNDAQGYFGLGLALTKLEQLPQAEKALETAALIDSQSVEVYKTLCDVYEVEGRSSQAFACKETVHSLTIIWLTFGYDEFNTGYYQREGLPVQDLPVVILWQEMVEEK